MKKKALKITIICVLILALAASGALYYLNPGTTYRRVLVAGNEKLSDPYHKTRTGKPYMVKKGRIEFLAIPKGTEVSGVYYETNEIVEKK